MDHFSTGESLKKWISFQLMLTGDQLVQLYYRQQLIASHPRKRYPGMTTDEAHRPKRHQKHQQWTPGRLKQWASSIGPDTLKWVSQRMEEKAHPEQAYRLCLGLLSLSRQYPAQRLNGSCKIANQEGLAKLKQIKSILASNRDQLPEPEEGTTRLSQDHENIRGPHTFH